MWRWKVRNGQLCCHLWLNHLLPDLFYEGLTHGVIETGGTIEISVTSVQETGTLCDPVVIVPETYYQS